MGKEIGPLQQFQKDADKLKKQVLHYYLNLSIVVMAFTLTDVL